MGYNTEFVGELKFEVPLTLVQAKYFNNVISGQDVRDHHEWADVIVNKCIDLNAAWDWLVYIDLDINEEGTGLAWSGAEKSYSMVDQINIVTALMWDKFGNDSFKLSGSFLCQGEDIEDRYVIKLDDRGIAHKEPFVVGGVVECPNCGHKF